MVEITVTNIKSLIKCVSNTRKKADIFFTDLSRRRGVILVIENSEIFLVNLP